MRERQRDSATGGNSDIRGKLDGNTPLRELDENPVGAPASRSLCGRPPQCLMAVIFWIHYLTRTQAPRHTATSFDLTRATRPERSSCGASRSEPRLQKAPWTRSRLRNCSSGSQASFRSRRSTPPTLLRCPSAASSVPLPAPSTPSTSTMSRAERNQTKGRSKTLPPRLWGRGGPRGSGFGLRRREPETPVGLRPPCVSGSGRRDDQPVGAVFPPRAGRPPARPDPDGALRPADRHRERVPLPRVGRVAVDDGGGARDRRGDDRRLRGPRETGRRAGRPGGSPNNREQERE